MFALLYTPPAIYKKSSDSKSKPTLEVGVLGSSHSSERVKRSLTVVVTHVFLMTNAAEFPSDSSGPSLCHVV